MKKIFKNIMLSAFVAALWSCAADEAEFDLTLSPDYLDPMQTSVSVSGENNSSVSFKINASTEWTITKSVDWIQCTPSSGTGEATVTIQAKENPTALEQREATLTLSAKGMNVSHTITVVQDAAEEKISVSAPDRLNGAGDDRMNLTVTSNTHWRVTRSDAQVQDKWLIVGTEEGDNNGEIPVSVNSRNYDSNDRTVTLTLTGDRGTTTEVRVSQSSFPEGITISSPNAKLGGYGSSSIELVVSSDTEWTAQCSDSWATLDVTEGGSGSTTITVSTNERNYYSERAATIQVTGKHSTPQKIVERIVYQESAPEQVEFFGAPTTRLDANGDSVTVSVRSNTDWTISLNEEAKNWMTIEPMSGTNDGTITLYVRARNTTEFARTATIYVEGVATQVRDVMEVSQAAIGLPIVADVSVVEKGRDYMNVSSYFETALELSEIEECGFCYSMTQSIPTLENSTVIVADRSDKTFRAEITGLDSPIIYYVRAYVKSIWGVGYSAVSKVKVDGAIPEEDENDTPDL